MNEQMLPTLMVNNTVTIHTHNYIDVRILSLHLVHSAAVQSSNSDDDNDDGGGERNKGIKWKFASTKQL